MNALSMIKKIMPIRFSFFGQIIINVRKYLNYGSPSKGDHLILQSS